MNTGVRKEAEGDAQLIKFNPWCAPFICRNNFVRVIWDGRDVTPEVDHRANRRSCEMANAQNAKSAKLFGMRPPYYHYDALSGRALEINVTPSPADKGQEE